MSSIRTFQNVRVRMSRPATGEWLAGWVSHLARDEARVRLWAHVDLEAGEVIQGECYGQGTLAQFDGKVVAQAGKDVAMEILGSITYAPSAEPPRIHAFGLVGRLTSSEATAALRVLDVSPQSLGGVLGTSVRPGEEMTMSLPTEMGPIAATLSVANCRPEADAFRVGLHIVAMARLDRARWGRLVSERAEA